MKKSFHPRTVSLTSSPADGIRRCRFVLIVAILLLTGRVFAADPAADFSAGNQLYAQGKFAAAAAAYEQILHSEGQSPALLFNCGNAEFKAGRLGRAIAAFRRAELLAPHDAEIRANLAFVRSQVPGSSFQPNRWLGWVSQLSLNEAALLAAFFLWVVSALRIARQLQPALAPKLRSLTRLATALCLFTAGVLAVQAANHFNSAVAVVTVPEAIARSGPFDDAQTAFTLHDGVELGILERHDHWVQVADGTGKIGWLNDRQVDILPGA